MSEQDGKVFQVQYQDKASVYNCYMSFTKDGGLFVPCSHAAALGDSILLMVKLPETPETILVAARVAWVSHGRRRGFGVRLSADEGSKRLKIAIENLLTTSIKSATPTYTM